MKKLTFLVASFVISMQLIAQESELKANLTTDSQFDKINLNSYKQANYKQATMDVGFGLNGRSSADFSTSKTKHNNALSNGSFSYTKTRSSRDYIGNQNVSFGYYAGFGFGDYTSTPTSSKSLFTGLYASTNNRFYLTSNYFFDLNLHTSNTINYNQFVNELESADSIITRNDFQTSNIGSIQFGKGRIENVTDARLAIYILDDLVKHGRLSRVPNEVEVFEFADFITKTLNKRVIDDRIKQIMQYVAVDSFLVANGLTTKSDGLSFGLISDNWRYARLQNWSTGHAWYFGVSPMLSYNNTFYETSENNLIIADYRYEYSNYGIGINTGYNSSWIKGIKCEDGLFFRGTFNLLWNNVIPYEVKKIHSLLLTAGYYRTYIPNTRTSITGRAYLLASKHYNDSNDILEISPTIDGNCNYYLSEKVRFSLQSSLYYRFNKEYNIINAETKHFEFAFSASIKYYIF